MRHARNAISVAERREERRREEQIAKDGEYKQKSIPLSSDTLFVELRRTCEP
jgi:hypothetical protein